MAKKGPSLILSVVDDGSEAGPDSQSIAVNTGRSGDPQAVMLSRVFPARRSDTGLPQIAALIENDAFADELLDVLEEAFRLGKRFGRAHPLPPKKN
jgi:hypothetical protein